MGGPCVLEGNDHTVVEFAVESCSSVCKAIYTVQKSAAYCDTTACTSSELLPIKGEIATDLTF